MVEQRRVDDSFLATIAATPRAMVFLSVTWSAPERVARAAFLKTAERLGELGLGVACFVLDEEDVSCPPWLATLGIPWPEGGPAGAGSVLWLEHGRVIAAEQVGQSLRAVGMIAKSRELWG